MQRDTTSTHFVSHVQSECCLPKNKIYSTFHYWMRSYFIEVGFAVHKELIFMNLILVSFQFVIIIILFFLPLHFLLFSWTHGMMTYSMCRWRQTHKYKQFFLSMFVLHSNRCPLLWLIKYTFFMAFFSFRWLLNGFSSLVSFLGAFMTSSIAPLNVFQIMIWWLLKSKKNENNKNTNDF